MIEYADQKFSDLFDRGGALSLDSIRLANCTFENSAFSLTTILDRRSSASNLDIVKCSANGCDVGPAVFRNIRIDSLSTNDLLIVWGALFDRVKLSGSIGKIKINPFVHHSDRSESTQGPFDRAREEFYRTVEWALDISEAKFKEFDVRGIPAKLIRRDPETQVVVTRERAMRPGWREQISAANTLWPFMINLFLSDGDQDIVLAAPLGAPKAKRDSLINGLNELRRLGVAEPE